MEGLHGVYSVVQYNTLYHIIVVCFNPCVCVCAGVYTFLCLGTFMLWCYMGEILIICKYTV